MGSKGGGGGAFVERGTPLSQNQVAAYSNQQRDKKNSKSQGGDGSGSPGYAGGEVSNTGMAREGLALGAALAVGVTTGNALMAAEAYSRVKTSAEEGYLGGMFGISEFGEDKETADAAVATTTAQQKSDPFGSLLDDGDGQGNDGFGGGFGGDMGGTSDAGGTGATGVA